MSPQQSPEHSPEQSPEQTPSSGTFIIPITEASPEEETSPSPGEESSPSPEPEPQCSSYDLLNNGGFETGDFSSWSLSGDDGTSNVVTSYPQIGTHAATFTTWGGIDTLQQPFTEGDCFAPRCTFSFWVYIQECDSSCSFSAAVGNLTLFDSTVDTSLATTNNEYQLYKADFIKSVELIGTSQQVTFMIQNSVSIYELDHIAVWCPEPEVEPEPEPEAEAEAQCSSWDLLNNGGFETGDFSSWTLSEILYPGGVIPFNPQSGIYSAEFGSVDDIAVLQQPFTEGDCFAPTCTFSFWLWILNCDASCFFSAAVGNLTVFDSTVDSNLATDTNGYQLYTANFVKSVGIIGSSQEVTFMF